WINGLLEGERDEFLGRGRHVALDESHDNYRNGYRPRRINFFGLGEIELKVPRDRQGEFTSQWLPERKGQDAELEAFLAEAFLAGADRQTCRRQAAAKTHPSVFERWGDGEWPGQPQCGRHSA